MRFKLRTLIIVVAVAALLLGAEVTRRRWVASRREAALMLLEEQSVRNGLRRQEQLLATVRSMRSKTNVQNKAELLSQAERELAVEAAELRQRAAAVAARRRALRWRW